MMGRRGGNSFQKDHHIGFQGFYSHIAPKPSNSLKRFTPANCQFATFDDFDDNAVVDVKRPTGLSHVKFHSLLRLIANRKKLKVASGDDDLPKRDDFAERRKKYEKWVLAGTGIKTEVTTNDDNDVCKQAKILQPTKLAAKAKIYSTDSRKSAVPSLREETVDGKRHITSQMLKNLGLTRSRNKSKKNPRKNYKLKHQKAVKNRKGQVRSIKIPFSPYSGESFGINANISRSIRFKN